MPDRYLDLGQYSTWSEEKRIEWLEQELNGKRPLIPANMTMTPEVGSHCLLAEYLTPPIHYYSHVTISQELYFKTDSLNCVLPTYGGYS